MTQDLLDLIEKATPEKAFDGETYDPVRDYERLGKQMRGVVRMLSNGLWYTLAELAEGSGGSEAGASARLRDLRKRKYGSQNIERQRLSGGLWVYRWVNHPGAE